MATEEQRILKVHCNHCGDSTNHRLVHEKRAHGYYLYQRDDTASDEPDDPEQADWRHEYAMLECCGCESICLRQISYIWDPVNDTTDEDTQFYPPRVFRRLPRWHNYLPPELGGLLSEVYAALAADGRRLAVMGARALVDMVIVDKVGDRGPFRSKLEALETDGYISKANRVYLEAAIEAGSAAAHRGHLPPVDSVEHVIDCREFAPGRLHSPGGR